MKKYVIGIILMVLVLVVFLVNNIIKTQASRVKEFYDSGYILQAMNEDKNQEKIETYYFNENEKYKNLYNTKTEFKDINRQNIITSNDSFIHYKDNSISSLKKGVIINLEDIEKDPICYYSLVAGKVLKYSGEGYVIQNLSEELKFQKFIYKISDNKYLIAGNLLKIKFNDGTEKQIEEGYIEFEYCDNKIVRLYNKELNYQTVSSEVYIEVDDITIDLGTTIISKNSENKMSLLNMVIDSDDNIEIVDLSQEESKVEQKEENTLDSQTQNENNGANQNLNQNQSINQNGGTNSEVTNNNQSQGVVVEGEGQDNGEDNSNETYVPQTEENSAPIYRVEEFEVDAINLDARISINGNVESLISDTIIKIIDNKTQNILYENNFSSTTYNMDISVQNLIPNTEYTLIAEASYKVGEVTYTKNFVYKIFRTHTTGVTFEKECFTEQSLSFKVYMDEDSKIESAELALFNEDNKEVGTRTPVYKEGENPSIVLFDGLESNKKYTAKLINVKYNGEVIENGIEEGKVYKTLKNKPQIGDTVVEIDKRNSKFITSLANITDSDSGIQSYRCEIYKASEEENGPVYVANSQENEAFNIPVDGTKLERDVPYIFKFIITFNDNEKIIEYENVHDETISMDGSEFPKIRFEEEEVTFEKIKGQLIIDDENATILLESEITIDYTDSTGNTRTIKRLAKDVQTNSGFYISIDENNLKANETYKFLVKASIDLHDENGTRENCFIGGIVVKTKEPNPMKVNYEELGVNQDKYNAFALKLQLVNKEGITDTLEASTLTGMTVELYSGENPNNSTPIATKVLKDNNVSAYKSTLKEQYFDNEALITPEWFGKTNEYFQKSGAEVYTIKITNAYDYTDYPNNLPIENSTCKITIKGFMPGVPENINDAINVTSIINMNSQTPNNDLDGSTVVGYKVQAKNTNLSSNVRNIIYRAYDANTNKLIKELDSITVNENSKELPSAVFNIENGTDRSTVDEDYLRRGNSYYFTYELEIDLDGDGQIDTHYPQDVEGWTPGNVLKSKTQDAEKQKPMITIYPSNSTENTITFKYRLSDIDHAIEIEQPQSKEKGRYLYAYIDNAMKSNELINLTQGEEERIVTLSNLQAGVLKLQLNTRLMKYKITNDDVMKLWNYYYEGIQYINSVQYKLINLEENKLSEDKVVIELTGDEIDINRITACKVEYSVEGRTFTTPLMQIEDNKLTTNLSDFDIDFLRAAKEKSVTLKVYAYYDTGRIGYDIASEENSYTYQKAYVTSENIEYLSISANGAFVPTPKIAAGCIYEVNRNKNILNIQNKIDGRQANIELAYSESGFIYEGNNILQKEIGKTEVTTTEGNTFSFDIIAPSIKLNTSDITPALLSVNINATIKATGISDLENVIYIDVYETDSTGKKEDYITTIQKNIEEFTNKVEITNLMPKKNYFIKFKIECGTDENGEKIYKYLYDVFQQINGAKYYFNTLSNIGITNINVKYQAENYNKKDIVINYNVDIIADYKIKHEIYKWNEEQGAYSNLVFEDAEDSYELPPNNTNKSVEKVINANPGTGWEFNQKYLLVIKPLKEESIDEDGNVEYIELWTEETKASLRKEFTLDSLKEPIVMIRTKRDDINTSINFNITIYDDDKVIKDGKYKIQVFEDGNDITEEKINPKPAPEELNINTTNKIITVENVDFTKEYKMIVKYNADYDNNGEIEESEKQSKIYTLKALNTEGISVGIIKASITTTGTRKIRLEFTDTYKLADIDYISYRVVSADQNFSVNKTEIFTPTRPSLQDDYYTFDLNASPQNAGYYYIELQFFKDKELVDTVSTELYI